MMLDGSVDLEEERRLRSFLLQLRTESAILDRMIYKNKNQHRRCPYFQSLLKVRRDVRLLLSVGLEEILSSASQVIHGKNPSQRIYLLERLKKKLSSGRHNFQERLLGASRLLSEMVEPIIRAAIQISSLLARSFFMGFSLTILSLLARLRVLVQQMLVDAVSVFNRVSCLAQRKHTIKLTKNGVEVFGEYYPPSGEVLSLDCSWQGDKFVLLERMHVSRREGLEEDLGAASLETLDIQYRTLEPSDEDEEAYSKKTHEDFAIKELASYVDTGRANAGCCEDESNNVLERSSAEPPCKDKCLTTGISSLSSQGLYDQSARRKEVAFVPVTVTPEATQIRPKKMKLDDPLAPYPLDSNETEDSFFKLLTAGSIKSSLFD